MYRNLNIVEFAIALNVVQYNPTLLHPSFLMASGIVPKDWEFAQQPQVSNRFSQIIFNNGVKIIAQPNRIVLVEAFTNQLEEKVEVSDIACRLIEALPNLEYQAVSNNFRGYISFAEENSGVRDYLFKGILAPGNWQEIGTAPIQTALNFLYTFEQKRLNLIINEASLQVSETDKVPSVLFSGNFDYDLKAKNSVERNIKLQEIVKDWHADKKIYREVVNQFAQIQIEPELIFPATAYAA
ncbi:MAG: hypothetical protein MUD14_19510 [Hydrococcus sp. Prado102]|jgi:hypothetical protein|nr:hypothetical protein [Hydrococcus sp. Prado102]